MPNFIFCAKKKEECMGISDKIKKNYFNRHFIIFVVIGGVNTLNNMLLSYAFNELLRLGTNVSFVLGYLCSLVIAYILNSKFNFKQRMNVRAMLKFFVSYIPNFIIQNAVVFLMHNTLGLPSLLAYGTAAVLGIPVTFIIIKAFVFMRKHRTDENAQD